jgi:hypothetical protein
MLDTDVEMVCRAELIELVRLLVGPRRCAG